MSERFDAEAAAKALIERFAMPPETADAWLAAPSVLVSAVAAALTAAHASGKREAYAEARAIAIGADAPGALWSTHVLRRNIADAIALAAKAGT